MSLAASIISSKLNKALSKDSIYIWEISLTWKVKKPIHLEKRIKEAEKMWFENIYCPKTDLKAKKSKITQVNSINDLVEYLK